MEQNQDLFERRQNGYMRENTEYLIQELTKNGWKDRDFERNQMLYAYEMVSGFEGKGHDLFRKYWLTVGRLYEVLIHAGIKPVILKSRRNYPFYDSNVDILISKEQWPIVISALESAHWRLPSKPVQFKQNMIERSKLKLPCRNEEFMPAHLYGAVTWRYQSDVGFLPMPTEDNKFLEHVQLAHLCPDLPEVCGIEVIMPTPAADILIHAAQTVYENYRLFLGEALYFDYLWKNVPTEEIEVIDQLANRNGASLTLELVKNLVEAKLHNSKPLQAENWPCSIRLRSLLETWLLRARFRHSQGKPIRAVEEFSGYLLFSILYAVKRKLWSALGL